MTAAYLSGLFLGLSLIVAIGAQNAFVLRQGLRGEHVFAVCLACALSDGVLIGLGATGLALLAAKAAWTLPAMRYGGAAFLLAYGLRSLAAALKGGGRLAPAEGGPSGLAAALSTCLLLTWANPHVYLDTVLLLGSVSARQGGGKAAFALGAVTASFLFFFTLGYGARLLRPFFARPAAWRGLDGVVGCVMLWLGLRLATG